MTTKSTLLRLLLPLALSAFILACETSISLGESGADEAAEVEIVDSRATDRVALTALNNATDVAAWEDDPTWMTDTPLGDWHGVTTDDSGNVIALNLFDSEVKGELPPEIGDFINLERLDLAQNQLTGKIPPELGQLTNLNYLDLRNNQLSGELPPELGNLANIQTMHFGSNRLSGEIPSELGLLTNLVRLGLGINQLSGEIPQELESLTSLESLDLAQNQLNGCIPAALEGQLEFAFGAPFCVSSPHADRDALVALFNATDGPNWENNTNWLSDLPIDRWFGVIPDPNGGVMAINLERNGLMGEIPPELGSLSNLNGLTLAGNQLSGEIPPELGNLTKLERLDLSRNQLSGQIPLELTGIPSLTYLFLNNNNLTGEIPEELGALANLTSLHLRGNQLGGCVSAALQSQLDMRFSNLGDVPFCGSEPTRLTGSDRDALVALYTATVGDDWFVNTNWLSEEPIGEWHGVTVDANGQVIELSLRSNWLQGEIPSQLGDLANLQRLDLLDNMLSGEIPPELGNLTNLVNLNLQRNQLTGQIPSELGQLSNLTALVLSYNSLTGEIPGELGNLSSLRGLILGWNDFGGDVPAEFGNLANLEVLNLDTTGLYGCVPDSLESRLDGERSNLGHLTYCRIFVVNTPTPVPNP